MRGITDHPDDFDREWAYRIGYAHGAEAAVAALRPHLPEANPAQSGNVACL
jgi:hypothetical protein